MFWKLRAAVRIATERDHRLAEASYRMLIESDPERRLELWKEFSQWMAPGISREILDILTWSASTEADRFRQLIRLSRCILPGYRFTWPSLDWWKNAEFNSYLSRFGELDGLNTHRRWVIYQLMRLTAGVIGDTAECGVYQGAGSYLMAMANRARGDGSLHHAFDSFEGLSQPTARDSNHWHAGALACDLESVRRNLHE